jgi:uncharacterized protein YjiS (DUF1127 family)
MEAMLDILAKLVMVIVFLGWAARQWSSERRSRPALARLASRSVRDPHGAS